MLYPVGPLAVVAYLSPIVEHEGRLLAAVLAVVVPLVLECKAVGTLLAFDPRQFERVSQLVLVRIGTDVKPWFSRLLEAHIRRELSK